MGGGASEVCAIRGSQPQGIARTDFFPLCWARRNQRISNAMPRGGPRPGSGRKPGSKNRPKLQLTAEEPAPSGKPTASERMRALKRHVARLVADDMAKDKIAAVMGIPLDRLEKLFGHELEHGREIMRAEVLARLDAAGDAGSVSADRALEALTAKPSSSEPFKPGSSPGKKDAARAAAEAAANGNSVFAPPRQPGQMGKKELRLINAEHAGKGSEWGDELLVPGATPPEQIN